MAWLGQDIFGVIGLMQLLRGVEGTVYITIEFHHNWE